MRNLTLAKTGGPTIVLLFRSLLQRENIRNLMLTAKAGGPAVASLSRKPVRTKSVTTKSAVTKNSFNKTARTKHLEQNHKTARTKHLEQNHSWYLESDTKSIVPAARANARLQKMEFRTRNTGRKPWILSCARFGRFWPRS